jgi:hypothetical protein
MTISRRTFLTGSVAAWCAPALADDPGVRFDFSIPDGAPDLLEWDLGRDRRVAILQPSNPTARRLPVVIALHGRGETKKPPRDGALGWPRDYALLRAMGRVTRPPLTPTDYEGFVRPEALAATNQSLGSRPFRGLVLVCPRVPDIPLADEAAVRAFGDWIAHDLIPKVRADLPVIDSRESTGIDGVSLGGALAMRVGFRFPEVFGAIGTLQPAVVKSDGPTIEAGLRAARARAEVAFRLTTSTEDFFRPAVSAVHQHLRSVAIDHDYSELLGPHDYPFNRGPGAMELLLWQDRRLAH